VETGRVFRTLIGLTSDVICIAFSPDGRRIATTGYDRTVKLRDTATDREVFTLRGHIAGVVAPAFSPDGFRIVSGGLDNTARTVRPNMAGGTRRPPPWVGLLRRTRTTSGVDICTSCRSWRPGAGQEFGAPARTYSESPATRPNPRRRTALPWARLLKPR
jgi:WD40 repeat protein